MQYSKLSVQLICTIGLFSGDACLWVFFSRTGISSGATLYFVFWLALSLFSDHWFIFRITHSFNIASQMGANIVVFVILFHNKLTDTHM